MIKESTIEDQLTQSSSDSFPQIEDIQDAQ